MNERTIDALNFIGLEHHNDMITGCIIDQLKYEGLIHECLFN